MPHDLAGIVGSDIIQIVSTFSLRFMRSTYQYCNGWQLSIDCYNIT